MSLNSSPVLQLEPRLAPVHRRLWGAMLGVAAAITWFIPALRLDAALGLSLMNVTMVWIGWRHSLATTGFRVLWDASGGWWLIDAQGRRKAVELRSDSVVYPGYWLLRWNCEGRRMQRLVLRADCAPAEWRRWQARLHWQALRATPPGMSL